MLYTNYCRAHEQPCAVDQVDITDSSGLCGYRFQFRHFWLMTSKSILTLWQDALRNICVTWVFFLFNWSISNTSNANQKKKVGFISGTMYSIRSRSNRLDYDYCWLRSFIYNPNHIGLQFCLIVCFSRRVHWHSLSHSQMDMVETKIAKNSGQCSMVFMMCVKKPNELQEREEHTHTQTKQHKI